MDSAERVVVKLGGDNATLFEENVGFVKGLTESGKKVALVVSAARSSDLSTAIFNHQEVEKGNVGFNTTTHLIALAKLVKDREDGNPIIAYGIQESIKAFFTHIIDTKMADNPHHAALKEVIEQEFGHLHKIVGQAITLRHIGHENRFFSQGADHMFSADDGSIFSFTGFGEELTAALYDVLLAPDGDTTVRLNTMPIQKKIFGRNPNKAIENVRITDRVIAEVRDAIVALLSADTHVCVVPGRLPGAAESRGYSDVAASIVAVATQGLPFIAKQSTIRTADPRKCPDARVVREMGASLAVEAFGTSGANAKAMHPDAMRLLSRASIEVVVGNPQDRSAGSTLIHKRGEAVSCAEPKLIAIKDVPTVITIKSESMADHEGVMSHLTDLVKQYGIADIYTTDASVTFTFNEEVGKLAIQKLKRYMKGIDAGSVVKTREDQAMIYCLGDDMNSLEVLARGASILKRENILSTAAQQNGGLVVKFLIKREDQEKALQVLHEELIKKADVQAFA